MHRNKETLDRWKLRKSAHFRAILQYPANWNGFNDFKFQVLLISDDADFRDCCWFQSLLISDNRDLFPILDRWKLRKTGTSALSKKISQVPSVSPISTFEVVLISDYADFRDGCWFQSVLISDSKNLFQILTKLLPKSTLHDMCALIKSLISKKANVTDSFETPRFCVPAATICSLAKRPRGRYYPKIGLKPDLTNKMSKDHLAMPRLTRKLLEKNWSQTMRISVTAAHMRTRMVGG